MKSTYTVKLRKDGSILVPKALRMLYGVKHGTAFNVEVSEDNISYHPAHITCPVCGKSVESCRSVITDQICPECDAQAAELISNGNASTMSQALKLLASIKESEKPRRRKATATVK